jgi:RHS repeat-associated protein
VDEENGLVYYGYRYHSPPQGRWPSRDPFGEEGFEGNKYFSFKAEDLQSLESADFDEDDLPFGRTTR